MNEINCFLDQISKWKLTLCKEKKVLNHKRLEKLSEKELDVQKMKNFTNMWSRFDTIITGIATSQPGSMTTQKDLKFCMSAVMLSILFHSWQRPAAVKNLILCQFQKAVKVDNVHVASVTDHKTGVGGAARLMFNPDL